ncbi:helix-turn-helix domain-containing protein [Altererythrobacter arenosus]|uniref:Helix-turn-helix domain-containing protein n=1 Tax=Altererythrobacter arenosus TaxID=3032592 RepID=A0ABY8G021_9SPHN|nr:helix-turn-helix domain-containing protein [Altererythrobacter sp. CAU 1644]WFL78951.1 helix-turn-helix domain-containing protein [Altererythrobacter sp. CAU 1644]
MALKAHLDTTFSTTDDNRGSDRRSLLLATSGSLPSGKDANVTVHNISQSGMLLETSLPLAEGSSILVDLPEAGEVEAKVVWGSGILFGCRFEGELNPAALSAAQLRASAPLPPGVGQSAVGRRLTGEVFGKRIEQMRKRRGLTLAEVAEVLGVSKPTVWAWEKGKARPVAERLPALAQVLGIDEAELVSFREPPGISELLDTSRERIAESYGTTPDKVRIMIEL